MTLLVRAGGGLAFHGQATLSGFGYILEPDGYKGLEDGVDIRRENVDRVGGHGSFDLPGYLDSRIASLSGNAIARTPQELVEMGSALTGYLAGGESGRIFAEFQGSTLWGDARLASKTKWKTRGAHPRTAEFQIQFWFANPRLFGESKTFPNADYTLAQVHHRGNFPAAPIHTVTGTNATGYTINGPGGRKFTVAKAVVAGSPHVIDMSTGWLTINGVVQTGAVTVADLWSIPGGGQVAHSITGAGLTLTTTVKDTYI